MLLIDLDKVNWDEMPQEFAGYASAEKVKEWMRKQPSIVGVVITESQNTKIRTRAYEVAGEVSRLIINVIRMMTEVAEEAKGAKT